MRAPESPSIPLNGNRLSGQPPLDGILPRQVVCVLVLALTDLSAIAFSLELAILMRQHFLPHVDARLLPSTFPFVYYLPFAWLWLMPLVFLSIEGLYTRRRSQWNEVGYLIKAIALSLIAMLAALALTQLSLRVSRVTILLTAMNLLIVLPSVRYWTKRTLKAIGPWRKRILILGATDMAVLAMRGLTSDPFLGYEVVGVLDDNPDKRGTYIGVCNGTPVQILGKLSEVREQMERTNAMDVLIAIPRSLEERLLTLVHELQTYCANIYVVPQLWGLPMMNWQVDGFLRERVMMLKLSNNLAKPWNGWLKRGFDLLLGTVLALMALPICVIVAILIRLDSKGPALFVQERLGYRGRNFRCLKFRTMCLDGKDILTKYLKSNPRALEEWQKYSKLRRHDPRLTRMGGFLRRWSLDELPQLFNVLKGEMSLVGPRPYVPDELSRIGADLHTILSARPGMTGFWQVSGRNQLSFDDRVELEAWYVRNWTAWLDCIVFVKTFRVVLFPENGFSSQDVAGSDPVLPKDSASMAVSPELAAITSKSRHHSAGL